MLWAKKHITVTQGNQRYFAREKRRKKFVNDLNNLLAATTSRSITLLQTDFYKVISKVTFLTCFP